MEKKKIYVTRLECTVLQEYFSGVPLKGLAKRYGMSPKRILSLASSYKKEEIDIFNVGYINRVKMAEDKHMQEMRNLQEKVKLLEESLKMANIKIEGYEYMIKLLKEEEGIDLIKKAAPGQSGRQRKDIWK